MPMDVMPTEEALRSPRPLDVGALRALALEDALRAHVTPTQRAGLVAWVTMLALAVVFLAAVGVSAVLDAIGTAF